jgi:hypothetical protein
MKKRCRAVLIFLVSFVGLVQNRVNAQLTLVQSIAFPGEVTKFDHFGVDLKHDRLFATMETTKCLGVFNLKTGKYIRRIGGLDEPHSVLYQRI